MLVVFELAALFSEQAKTNSAMVDKTRLNLMIFI
jgi:hypothetical protein